MVSIFHWFSTCLLKTRSLQIFIRKIVWKVSMDRTLHCFVVWLPTWISSNLQNSLALRQKSRTFCETVKSFAFNPRQSFVYATPIARFLKIFCHWRQQSVNPKTVEYMPSVLKCLPTLKLMYCPRRNYSTRRRFLFECRNW